jgi:hypothetical protein
MSELSIEELRLEEYHTRRANWKLWGPYLSDRQWGTVREDYSPDGEAWDFIPHDHARSRCYRWGEDGIAGISDRNQYLCFAPAFWNKRDPILKERLFGLSNKEGNHGEDVKEYYYYLDSTPTHSYMRMLYKYTQSAYPYTELVAQNQKRTKEDPEYELIDTGVLDQSSYFDCTVEYAKADISDILIRVTIANCGTEEADIVFVPNLWFRNTWSWGYPSGPMHDVQTTPIISRNGNESKITAYHSTLGTYHLYFDSAEEVIFTENVTNTERLFNRQNISPYVKDGFHCYLVNGDKNAINPASRGTKAAAVYQRKLAPKEQAVFRLRISENGELNWSEGFDSIFTSRRTEADEFYNKLQNPALSSDELLIQRQAFAGMLWSKQLYYLDVEQWLQGDPAEPPPPESRSHGRNRDWVHLTNFDIISMPDKWEFPWYAAWDLAFHCITLALVDGDFAKRQLELMTREWYMHPNGQLPAYEWTFSDVNPPVHGWAAWRVYKIDAKRRGKRDVEFLEGIFHKLLLNFTWWVNRKDAQGNNIFQGGFLGLDNIGVFDRSAPLPNGSHIDQADGTSWMAAYCLQLMKIAIELSEFNPVYQDLASKFLEHFLRVADAMTNNRSKLWDDEDGFFYDMLTNPDGSRVPLRVRSLVGLSPLFAVDTIEPETLERFPDFKRRLKWFVTNRPHLSGSMARIDVPGVGKRRLLSVLTKERLVRMLTVLLAESEFLSRKFINPSPMSF